MGACRSDKGPHLTSAELADPYIPEQQTGREDGATAREGEAALAHA